MLVLRQRDLFEENGRTSLLFPRATTCGREAQRYEDERGPRGDAAGPPPGARSACRKRVSP